MRPWKRPLSCAAVSAFPAVPAALDYAKWHVLLLSFWLLRCRTGLLHTAVLKVSCGDCFHGYFTLVASLYRAHGISDSVAFQLLSE